MKVQKISAVYKIVNTVTGDFYVGSSKNVKKRWAAHKEPSRWERCPSNQLYSDFQKYGVENFRFQILAPVMPECLTQVEQEFIEMLQPTYNNYNAKGFDVERQKKYNQSEKVREAGRKYFNQFCLYKGDELTLCALATRFHRAGIEHPVIEAKKYLIGGNK